MKTSWRVAPGVSVAEDSGSLLLLSPNGRYYGLDDLGRILWRGIEQGELETSLEQLHQSFGVPLTTLRKDADKLLAELKKAGLIVRAG